MTERVEQRICIKFCVKLEHSSAETIRMIQKAFGDNAMSAAQIKVWHKRFKDGRESVESDPRSGRPATSRTAENVERVRAAINKDQRLTVRELEADLGIPKTTVSEILTQDLGMKRVVAKCVPQLLLPEQKEHSAAFSNDLLQTASNEPDLLKKVVTRDGSWVYGYDLETKAQSSQWKSRGSPRQKKAWRDHSKIKTMLTGFFDWEGVVHHKYAPPGQTINKEYYLSVLRRLRDAMPRKQPQLCATGDWQLHHGNTPAHVSHLVQSFLVKHQITQVTQSPYSPDLVPCDFWLFPKLKSPLKEKRFQTVDEIEENTTRQLMTIPTQDFAE
ncbi:histone-lysine N-methyltransferase SETMAR-like [Eulemur rufifrons]|uniref:histone-lysine N-methyltransferase SETMAR-like n=1 Tax=Eulemur rufifrons TaxID=859984 RepID=UPI0037421823